MRNGLDISGVSEVVDEIGDKPVEAVMTFATTTTPTRRGADTSVNTAHFGTQRVGRAFTVPFTEDCAHPLGGMSPYEGAIAALGACVLITHVHGYSARAVTLTSLRVTASAAIDVDPDGRWAGGPTALRDVRLLVEVDGEGSTDGMREVTGFVTCFSPNHRAFIDEGDYHLAAVLVRPDGSSETVEVPEVGPPATAGEPTEQRVSAELVWEYGCEASLVTTFAPGGERRTARPGLVVDQSKQMLGIDRGPNPQELLLAAVSADLAMELGRRAAGAGVDLAGVEVDAAGKLDVRGMLNVQGGIPPRFHGLRFVVRADTETDPAAVAGLLAECAARNAVLAALRAAGTIDVEVRSATESLLAFRSDAAHVASLITAMLEAQAAAGADNPLGH